MSAMWTQGSIELSKQHNDADDTREDTIELIARLVRRPNASSAVISKMERQRAEQLLRACD